MTLLKYLGGRLFVLYIALNMAVCAVVFLPWARPRETVSGLIGRWLKTEGGWKCRFARRARSVVDRVYAWDEDHCVMTHEVEAQVYCVLYPVAPEKQSGGSKWVH